MIKDEDVKEPTYGNMEWRTKLGSAGVEWPHPAEEIQLSGRPWKLFLVLVFVVGLLIGVVLAG